MGYRGGQLVGTGERSAIGDLGNACSDIANGEGLATFGFLSVNPDAICTVAVKSDT